MATAGGDPKATADSDAKSDSQKEWHRAKYRIHELLQKAQAEIEKNNPRPRVVSAHTEYALDVIKTLMEFIAEAKTVEDLERPCLDSEVSEVFEDDDD